MQVQRTLQEAEAEIDRLTREVERVTAQLKERDRYMRSEKLLPGLNEDQDRRARARYREAAGANGSVTLAQLAEVVLQEDREAAGSVKAKKS